MTFCIFWTNDVVDLSEGANVANILLQLATIKPLDGTNYSTWKKDIELMLDSVSWIMHLTVPDLFLHKWGNQIMMTKS